MEAQTQLLAYCMRKNIPPPISVNGGQAPAYVPVPAPMMVNPDFPPSNDGMGGPGGMGGMGGQP
jgi:hypothetical protein